MIDPANLPGKQILLVDDSKSARFFLRTLLQKHGFTVDLAESAEAAFETIKKAPPDAVFMDHMMPGMDGLTATVALKADPATAHIPVVMCTSNDGPEYLQKAKEIGALGILPKPPTPEKLREILDVLDRETTTLTQSTPLPAPKPAAPSMARSQDLETMLRAILPPMIEEALAPQVERAVMEHRQAIGSRDSAADLAKIETAIEQRLEARKLDWLREITDEAERQAAAEGVSAEQRLEKILVVRLAASARESQDKLKQLILADGDLRSSISKAATSGVEQLATEIAQQHAREVARKAANDLVPSLVTESLSSTERQLAALKRRMGWLSAATILVGLVGAAALYLSVAA